MLEGMMPGGGGGTRQRVVTYPGRAVVPQGWWGRGGGRVWAVPRKQKRYIYIFGVLPHLESTPLGRVEHQEALEEVLAVGGHVEGDAVLPSEDALPQLLPAGETSGSVSGNSGEHSGYLLKRLPRLTLRFCPSKGSEPLTRV